MRSVFVWSFGALAVVGLASFCAFAQAGEVKLHPHHHLHHALWELRDARKELLETKHNFGGHREKAILAIDDAIKQLDHILKNTGDDVKGVPTRGDLREEYRKYKHHPHTHHAIHELRHAHRQIKESRHDYGGHREAALRDIHVAITQLELTLKHHKI
jgi:hypothetical protein